MSLTPTPTAANGPGRLVGPAFTEVAGEPATLNQLERLCSRYQWVRRYCVARDVVEIACGTGQGLGLLKTDARMVAGGDYSAENLAVARTTYGSRIPLVRLDAHRLPIRTASTDVLALLETLYFLPNPAAFVREAARVLRPGGHLLVSVVNKDCWDFNPSPLYPVFFGTTELTALLRCAGFAVECFGIIPMDQPSLRQRLFHPIKRLAIALNLIPTTLQARRWLKRIAIGPLVPLPYELLPGSAPTRQPVPIAADHADRLFQVVLAAGRKS